MIASSARVSELQRSIAKVVKGKEDVIQMALMTLLARGHLLVRRAGVPVVLAQQRQQVGRGVDGANPIGNDYQAVPDFMGESLAAA